MTVDAGDDESSIQSTGPAPTLTTFIVSNGMAESVYTPLTNNYWSNDHFDLSGGGYINKGGQVLTNSPLVEYDSTSSRIVIKAKSDADFVINEIVIFNRALSPTEIDQMQAYLCYKWVCIESLPVTSRFFPDNYDSHKNPVMLDLRRKINASIYNVLDPVLLQLQSPTGSFQTFINNPPPSSPFINSRVQSTIEAGYKYRTMILDMINQYKIVFKYVCKANMIYNNDSIIPVSNIDPEAKQEIAQLYKYWSAFQKTASGLIAGAILTGPTAAPWNDAYYSSTEPVVMAMVNAFMDYMKASAPFGDSLKLTTTVTV
jgi:hypothetical protein